MRLKKGNGGNLYEKWAFLTLGYCEILGNLFYRDREGNLVRKYYYKSSNKFKYWL